MNLEHRQLGLIECKLANDDTGTFSGYGAVFGNVDAYGDVIERGAFKQTLSDWRAKGKWPKMLLQHGGAGFNAIDTTPIGQWTDMAEDAKGLKVQGKLFAMGTERGQYIYEGLKSGALDSLSIGYQTVAAYDAVKNGITTRHLTEIKLWETSIVTFPANDQALISNVKTFLTPENRREWESYLRDEGCSRREAEKAISAILKKVQGTELPEYSPQDEVGPGTAEAEAAAQALCAKFAVSGLKY